MLRMLGMAGDALLTAARYADAITATDLYEERRTRWSKKPKVKKMSPVSFLALLV